MYNEAHPREASLEVPGRASLEVPGRGKKNSVPFTHYIHLIKK
jgi:hypothetical protein